MYCTRRAPLWQKNHCKSRANPRFSLRTNNKLQGAPDSVRPNTRYRTFEGGKNAEIAIPIDQPGAPRGCRAVRCCAPGQPQDFAPMHALAEWAPEVPMTPGPGPTCADAFFRRLTRILERHIHETFRRDTSRPPAFHRRQHLAHAVCAAACLARVPDPAHRAKHARCPGEGGCRRLDAGQPRR